MLQSAVLAERAGIDIEIDSEAGWRTVLDTAVTRFAPDGGPEALFTLGPRPDLLGSPATGPGLASLDAALDPSAELDDVSVASRVLPAFLHATVTGASRGDEVAVAVNGTIRATTTVYADGDVLGVAAVVPPESFVDGANEVRFLRITG
jgi:hypothetical protein